MLQFHGHFVLVAEGHGLGYLRQYLGSLLGGHAISGGDDGGVHVLLYEVLAPLEQLPGHDDGGGGAVPALVVLGLGDLDYHLGRRVLHVYLLEYGHAVVGDDDVAHGVDQHLVHSLGSQGRADRLGHGLGRGDVVGCGVPARLPLGPFFQYQYRCLLGHHEKYPLWAAVIIGTSIKILSIIQPRDT